MVEGFRPDLAKVRMLGGLVGRLVADREDLAGLRGLEFGNP